VCMRSVSGQWSVVKRGAAWTEIGDYRSRRGERQTDREREREAATWQAKQRATRTSVDQSERVNRFSRIRRRRRRMERKGTEGRCENVTGASPSGDDDDAAAAAAAGSSVERRSVVVRRKAA